MKIFLLTKFHWSDMIFVINYSKEKCKRYKSFQDQALLKESILMYAQASNWTSQELTWGQILFMFSRKETMVNFITKREF